MYALNSGTSTVGNTANQIARLVVTNGTVTTSANAPQIGSVAGSVGLMTLSTGASWVLPTGTVLVGNAGTGTLTVQNGAAVSTSVLTLGSAAGSAAAA